MILFFIFLLRYYLITDCGSTATRINAYSYDDSVSSSSINLLGRESVRIPLSNAVHDVNAIKNIFDPLLSWAKNIIPLNDQKDTVFDFYGTSSMRQLERSERISIIKSAREYLTKDGTFSVDKYAGHVLSETDEASYLWIALNTLTGNLPDCQTFIASLEIASQNANFAVNIKSTKNIKEWSTSVKLPTQSFNIFTPIFTGFGMDEVIINHTVSLAAKSGSSEITSPCFLKGYKSDHQHFTVNGAGDFDQCYEDISQNILKDKNCKKNQNCIFGNVPQAEYQILYGLSTIFYTRQFYNLDETSKISEYITKGKEFCSKEYLDAVSENPDNEYVSRYCIYTAFITNFLQRGLGVTDDTNLHVTDTISGTEISYTLGIVIAYQYELDYGKTPLRWYEILLVVLFFVAFFGIIIGLIVCCCLKRKKKKLTENQIALLQYQWQESDSSYQRANGNDETDDIETNGNEEMMKPASARVAENINMVAGQIAKTDLQIKENETGTRKDMAPDELLQNNASIAASKMGDAELKIPESASEKLAKDMGKMASKMGDIQLDNNDDRSSLNNAMKEAVGTFQPKLQLDISSDQKDVKMEDNQAHPDE